MAGVLETSMCVETVEAIASHLPENEVQFQMTEKTDFTYLNVLWDRAVDKEKEMWSVYLSASSGPRH